MSFGALVVFISLSSGFCALFTVILQAIPILKGVQPVIDQMNALERYAEPEPNGGKTVSLDREITVRDLHFSYNAESPVLQGVSMRLRRGGKYALIGESGCGKSTLIHLLTGDYLNYQGQICYDGTELRELDRKKLYQTVSYIQQEVFLFDDTIRNNICLYETFDEAAFQQAVRLSGVWKFAGGLEGGVEYRVGEGGQRLSGGQRQRIAIARALLRSARFLILDEGTSALDPENALEIESLLLHLPDLTLLTITHHLREEGEYDQVFRMRDGKLQDITDASHLP